MGSLGGGSGGLWTLPSLLQQLLGSRGRWADYALGCVLRRVARKEAGEWTGVGLVGRCRAPPVPGQADLYRREPVGQAPWTRCRDCHLRCCVPRRVLAVLRHLCTRTHLPPTPHHPLEAKAQSVIHMPRPHHAVERPGVFKWPPPRQVSRLSRGHTCASRAALHTQHQSCPAPGASGTKFRVALSHGCSTEKGEPALHGGNWKSVYQSAIGTGMLRNRPPPTLMHTLILTSLCKAGIRWVWLPADGWV